MTIFKSIMMKAFTVYKTNVQQIHVNELLDLNCLDYMDSNLQICSSPDYNTTITNVNYHLVNFVSGAFNVCSHIRHTVPVPNGYINEIVN